MQLYTVRQNYNMQLKKVYQSSSTSRPSGLDHGSARNVASQQIHWRQLFLFGKDQPLLHLHCQRQNISTERYCDESIKFILFTATYSPSHDLMNPDCTEGLIYYSICLWNNTKKRKSLKWNLIFSSIMNSSGFPYVWW